MGLVLGDHITVALWTSAASGAVSYDGWRCTVHPPSLTRPLVQSAHNATQICREHLRNLYLGIIVTLLARRYIRRIQVEETPEVEITECRGQLMDRRTAAYREDKRVWPYLVPRWNGSLYSKKHTMVVDKWYNKLYV